MSPKYGYIELYAEKPKELKIAWKMSNNKGALLYTVRCGALDAVLGSPFGRAGGEADWEGKIWPYQKIIDITIQNRLQDPLSHLRWQLSQRESQGRLPSNVWT